VGGLNYSTRYAYNFTTGDRISVTSPEGNTTSYTYDNIDRLTTVTNPAIGGVQTQRRTVYDDVNHIVTQYDENGNYGKAYYDGLGRVMQIQTYANGNVYSTTTSAYYWNDKLKTFTDQTGNITTYTYDFFGRTLTLTHPDGTFKQWSYNDANSQVTANDEKGHPTVYTYDWLGRLVEVTEYISGTPYNTVYSYDTVGNLLQVTDSKSQTTTYTYDTLNRLTQTTFPDNTVESRTYDSVGNLITRTTQNNTQIQYSYDQINRLTKIGYPDGSTVAYTYDKDGNRLGMVDSSGSTTYTYDPRDRLLSETRTIGSQQYIFGYGYDAASNLIQLTYPDGYKLTYTYDQLDRITAVGSLATFIYRLNNEISTITYGNTVETAYAYDKLGRVTRIHTWNSTATLLDLNYAYDANGNPTSVNSGQESYGYDDLNRLISGSGSFGTLSYTYDQVGNRLTATVNGTQTTYSYGSYNKLLSAGSTGYTYDPNGNTITKTTGSTSWTYGYDYESRLKRTSLNGQTVFQASYDGDGRRIETIAGDTTIYHYVLGSWDPAFVKDLTSGLATDEVFAAGLRVAKVQGAATSYYHLDRLGSVRLVTQTSSVLLFQTKYQPYGSLSATSGTEMFQFTGKQLDAATGLYYYGYRYYDSQSGRLITQDPKEANYQNPQSLNRYIYCLDNPNTYVDSNGGGAVLPSSNPSCKLGPLTGPLACVGVMGLIMGAFFGAVGFAAAVPAVAEAIASSGPAIMVGAAGVTSTVEAYATEVMNIDSQLYNDYATYRLIHNWVQTQIMQKILQLNLQAQQQTTVEFAEVLQRLINEGLSGRVMPHGPNWRTLYKGGFYYIQVTLPNGSQVTKGPYSPQDIGNTANWGTPASKGFYNLPAGEPPGTTIKVIGGKWVFDGSDWDWESS
jgi:RHS repeat-associated protein